MQILHQIQQEDLLMTGKDTKRQPGRKAMDKNGKTLTVVQVSGFIRNQPYGKGRAERKTIWIDGFTRGQWVNTGLSYVTVKD